MPSLIYTISLNSSIDFTFYLHNIIKEDVNRIEKIRVDPGGKGVNIVRMLKKLNEEATVITFIGKNNGEIYINLLKKEKVNFIPISIEGDLRNIYNFISMNKVLRFNEKGPKISIKEINKFWDVLLNLNLKKDDFLVMSGSVPPGFRENIYAEIIKKTRKLNLYTVVDADGNVLRESIKEGPFLIKPNLKEIERCYGINIKNFDNLKNLCNSIIESSGVKIILLTNGKKGAILFTKNICLYAKPPKVNFKSSIGCGDAFLAGFLYKFKNNKKYDECLKFGVACGAAKAEEEGTKMPSIKKIIDKLKEVKIYENFNQGLSYSKTFFSP